MKLVYVTNVINETTGLERMISVQTNYFIEHYNYNIDIVLLEQSSDGDEEFFDFHKNINRYYLDCEVRGYRRFLSKLKRLNNVLNTIEVDIIVVCVDDISGLFLPNFIKKKCKFVYQRHCAKHINLDASGNSPQSKLANSIKKFLVGYGGKGYDKFVILSDDHRNDWKRIRNIEVIGNPLTIETDDSIASLDTQTILAVGRHVHAKGFDMLLKVWEIVRQNHPDWKLKIIGKKTTTLDLRQMARDLKVLDTIEFMEFSKNMKDEYLDASILACTSRIEGFPLVLLEAMSFGIPLVSFDCPYEPKTIINDSEDGILVELNNIESFTQSILSVIENDIFRKKLGNQAKNNIQRFRPEHIMPLWKNLFENLKVKK